MTTLEQFSNYFAYQVEKATRTVMNRPLLQLKREINVLIDVLGLSGIPDWNVDTTYNAGDKVLFNSKIYTCTVNGTLGQPVSDGTHWQASQGALSFGIKQQTLIATTGQTDFEFTSFPEQVMLNGVFLTADEYGVDGNIVTISVAASANDRLTILYLG
jgi:hypothetical protein